MSIVADVATCESHLNAHDRMSLLDSADSMPTTTRYSSRVVVHGAICARSIASGRILDTAMSQYLCVHQDADDTRDFLEALCEYLASVAGQHVDVTSRRLFANDSSDSYPITFVFSAGLTFEAACDDSSAECASTGSPASDSELLSDACLAEAEAAFDDVLAWDACFAFTEIDAAIYTRIIGRVEHLDSRLVAIKAQTIATLQEEQERAQLTDERGEVDPQDAPYMWQTARIELCFVPMRCTVNDIQKVW